MDDAKEREALNPAFNKEQDCPCEQFNSDCYCICHELEKSHYDLLQYLNDMKGLII